mgnify:CR=1 FL=1
MAEEEISDGSSGEYKVRLDIFEGPLDLLLYLIKKDEVDIYGISIERITKQYLEYIETFKILNIDRDNEKVSLGLKQISEDPRIHAETKYHVGDRVSGKVVSLTDYGAFVELEQGVEGLIHVSEMSWSKRISHPSKVVDAGQEVEVMVLDIDEERRRISLGIKQCQQNPWDAFASQYSKGDKISGNIKSITDFGIFIGLEGAIDGLVHLSDISWNETGEEAVRNYKKGDEIETVILSIDPERERISLGVKQLEDDPFGNFVSANDRGAIVTGEVIEVDAKAVIVKLGEEVEGVLKASDISRDKVEDAQTKLKADIAGNAMVEISSIGNTVEGRALEMIRVGSPDAPHRVLIRARAHPWEPGSNWVLEGLIRRLLRRLP